MFRSLSRTIALLLAVLAGALFMGASPASAGDTEEYPVPDCTVSVDDETPEPGQTIVITGENFTPGSTVTVLVGGVEIEVTVDEDGTFETEYTIPSDAEAGDYEVTAEGCEGEDVLGTVITVSEPAAAPAPGALPRTGSSDTEPLVRTGAVLIAAGAVLVYAVRRRQQASAS